MSQIGVGSYVTHSRMPDWGLGKVLCRNESYLLVVFAGLPPADRVKRLRAEPVLLLASEVGSDELLDGLTIKVTPDCRQIVPAPRKRAAVVASAPPPTWTMDDALTQFRRRYPDAFRDAEYAPEERDWKVAKHQQWTDAVGAQGFRQLATTSPREAVDLILQLIQTDTPLLNATGEIVALREALHKPEFAEGYLSALADLLDAPTITSALFNKYIKALTSLPLIRAKSVDKWTIVTVVPFLVQPARHMLLKPERTKAIADRLGFELLYTPIPKWNTYERLLDLSNRLLEFLKPHGAVDMIDVQSFIWEVTDADS